MNWIRLVRYIALVLFFLSIIFFAFSSSEMIFNSPDENANAVFAWQFADELMLTIPSEFDQEWNVLVHPRSTSVVFNQIAPVSFLGLSIVAGLFALIFGHWSIVLITPMLALLAVIAWRQTINKIFKNERLADLSALFLMIHPAFLYYTARTMMHNVGFVALLIIGFYLFINQPFKFHWKNRFCIDEILAGLSVGLALAFRASEAFWIIMMIAVLFIWKYKEIGYRRILLFVVSIIIILLPFLALNDLLYGAPWITGYTVESEALSVSEMVINIDENDESFAGVLGILFPFGIHEMNILHNVWNYGFLLYPWLSGLSLLGLIFVFKKKEWQPWIIATVGLSIWMALVYGSWKFSDNPDASILTIGNSYVRYWLPLFVLASVFAGAAIDYIMTWIKDRRLSYLSTLPLLIVLMVVTLSMQLVVFGTDGLVKTHQNLESFIEKRSIVFEYTDDDSIIIVDMADKYLFPDRNIITPLRDSAIYTYIPEMIGVTDVYYFGITLPADDIEHLETVVFIDSMLVLEKIIEIDDETLYRIKRK